MPHELEMQKQTIYPLASEPQQRALSHLHMQQGYSLTSREDHLCISKREEDSIHSPVTHRNYIDRTTMLTIDFSTLDTVRQKITNNTEDLTINSSSPWSVTFTWWTAGGKGKPGPAKTQQITHRRQRRLDGTSSFG